MSKIIENRTAPSGEPIFSAYLHSKGRQLGLPISGTFELTSRCNFDCKMCYIHSLDCNGFEDRELSAEQWIELGRKARDAGMVFLLLTGGEPLLRKDFPIIYKELATMGFIISINTNASLIDDEIIKLFKEYMPSRVNVSLYGSCNETYASLCGRASFDKVMENLRKLKEAGVPFKINCSITPYNSGDIEDIHNIAKELEVNIKTASYMYPPIRNDKEKTGGNEGRFSACESAVQRVKCEMLKFGKDEFIRRAEAIEQGIAVCENECIEPTEEGTGIRCRAGVSSFWLNWEGYMSGCGMVPDEEFNVLEKSFDECWQGVREKTAQIRLPAECVTCKYRNLCSACAAACLCESGAFDKKPEYLCQQSKYTAELMKKEAERLKGENNGD